MLQQPRDPAWLRDVPRYTLLDGHSPLQPLRRFSAALRDLGASPDLEVWIKREDAFTLAFGGNKLRNLEFLVGDALAQGADTLITSGRRWSNHCRLTAASASLAGLACHLVLTGPPAAVPGPGQRLIEAFGGRVHMTTTADRTERETLVERVRAKIVQGGGKPYVIDVGGSNELGALGQVLAGLEVAGQAAAAGIGPRTIIVPSASGGTQAGLMVGLRSAGLQTRVVGMAVAQPAAELASRVTELVKALTRCTESLDAADVDIRDARGSGYGQRLAAADAAADLMGRTEAIMADPIYTAKGLAGLVDLATHGDLRGPVIFWHGGGHIGIFEPLDG